MTVTSNRVFYPTGATAYDLEQVVAFWPDADAAGFVNVSFVSMDSDNRCVVRMPQATFETAYETYLQAIGGTAVIRYLVTEAGNNLVTENVSYLII